MATSKKFSELPVASSMNNGDLFAVAQEDAQAETGYTSKSATAWVVGKKLNGEIEYATDLPSFPPGDQNPLDALEYLNSKINDLYPVDSASGSLVNFTTLLALPLVALKTNITAQGGGGTPSSPVAITGVSEVNVTRTGKNLASTHQGDGYVADKYLVESGAEWEASTNPQNWFVTEYIVCPDSLHFSCDSVGNAPSIVFYDINKQYIRGVQYQNRTDFQIPIPSGAKFFRASVNKTTNIMLVNGTSALPYAPYNADTFTLNLGQTIYGGYVDWKNGKLVVTHLVIHFNSQDLTWTYQDANTRFYTASLANVIEKPSTATVMPEGFNCECYNPHVYSGLADLDIAVAVSGNIFVKDANYTDVTNWLNAIGNQKFVYPLATPIEIDLPATMPSTIEGEQNWFADSGDIELEYKMGVQEYIDKKIAEVQALIL